MKGTAKLGSDHTTLTWVLAVFHWAVSLMIYETTEKPLCDQGMRAG